MSQSIVAKRYAKALFQVASEKGRLDEVAQEWQSVVDALDHHPKLIGWLTHPRVAAEEKKVLFGKLFANLSDTTRNLLFLLIDRNREDVIEAVGTEYTKLAHESKGVAEAEVVTARALTEEEEKELIAVFQKQIGKSLIVKNRVDSDLLGGVIVKIGDRLYDGSLAGKLERFRKQLTSSRAG
ncbi:F0F1 ATP synthase subunit delta [Marininema halotolerans]|uniref:ATP synthase subunit delta n=1 Tax=Marininema halotolerans TaxID=1155944 RepID=A0A1I6P2R0_9BACL|nr:F0F1 ATP synthase subunit delta [Marininema halotolerans]SFS34484.1 F-type H+-transporting ATPase subunit delta [Marininema halotolerans]